MRIFQVHNIHRYLSGSDIASELTTRILKERGHDVSFITRDSGELGRGIKGKIRAFASGIYSSSGRRLVANLIQEYKPDLVHVHELYPFFSPWILVECRQAGIPVVMTCHDYTLTCPISLHMRNGRICELCVGGREYWCVVKNCRGNIFESFAYAIRHTIARKFRLFQDNVTFFIAISKFESYRFIEAGFPTDRIVIVPNMVSTPDTIINVSCGEYIGYAGRISPEKGIETILAASQRTKLPVHLAGDCSLMPKLAKAAPINSKFVGQLNRAELNLFYQNAKFLVVPSICYEPFGLVVVEAMAQGLPVIASRIGGIPELVEDGVTGFLFEPGNAEDLANKMKLLWHDTDLCRQMGQAGRKKVIQEYSEDVYYDRLIALYKRAVEIERKYH